ncbi:MAG TPA: LuxR C-terminal-related transcriptional regulator [Rugosimonospora sp.]|nr:LuxR C-terminal-related transcriptional regulator [Rugosimonospora sp.]
MSEHPRAQAPARVGVQSGDRLRREILGSYLDTLPSVRVVGRVAHHADVLALHGVQRPGMVLLDADGDLAPALAVCRDLRERDPDLCLVLMCGRAASGDLAAARRTVDALVPQAHGFAALASVVQRLAAALPRPATPGQGLSDRQREILLLLAAGHNTGEIAERLGISVGTVEYHRRRVYAKLNATTGVQAVAQALAYGVIAGQAAIRPAIGSPPTPPPDRHPVLVVVAGEGPALLDRVLTTLVEHRYPVLRDPVPGRPDPLDGLDRHRGPVVRVLVDPAPEHWRAGQRSGHRSLLVHSGPGDYGVALAAFTGGAAAVLPVERIEEHLVPMVALVASGYRVIDEEYPPLVPPSATDEPLRPRLTARELDILRSIGRSHTLRQTARLLGIAVKTVENTQSHLFRKLGVRNRAEALTAAYSLGLLQPYFVGESGS